MAKKKEIKRDTKSVIAAKKTLNSLDEFNKYFFNSIFISISPLMN